MKSFILSALLLCSINTYALKFNGHVINKNNEPVSFANIVQMDKDSTFIAGGITDNNGIFDLPQLSKDHLIKISCIGYKDKWIAVKSNDTKLGDICIDDETTMLNEVVVKGNLPVTKIQNDGLVTSIQNTVLSKVGSAADVLGRIPGVIKKKDDYEVFGKGECLIYINGREVRDNTELLQINSENIKKVEVITNPGARYDASIKAVIRITTIKNHNNGIGIDLMSSCYQSQNSDFSEKANINYRHNKFDAFATAYYLQYKYFTDSEIGQYNILKNIWQQENKMYNQGIMKNLKLTTGLNYTFNEHNSIGIRYNTIISPKDYMTSDVQSTVLKDDVLYDKWKSHNITKIKQLTNNQVNLYYNGKINAFNIDLNADYLDNNKETRNNINEKSQEYNDQTVNSLDKVSNRLWAGKLIISTPILNGNFSIGSEYTYTNRKDDYQSMNNEVVPTSNNKIDEKNISAFFDYKRKIVSSLSFACGLRYEHVTSKYYEDDIYSDEQSKTYDNLFPNTNFRFNIGDAQVMLNYNLKTQRPSYKNLSNNIFYLNRLTMQKGNPYLRPSLIHDLSLIASWKFIQLQASYQQKRNFTLPWAEPDENNNEVTIIMPINYKKLPVMSYMMAISPTIGIWNPTLNLGITKQWLKTESVDGMHKYNKPIFTCNCDNIFSLKNDFDIEVEGNFQSKGHTRDLYIRDNIFVMNLSLRKQLLKKALTLEIGVNDLFYKQQDYYEIFYHTIKGYQTNKFDSREVFITARYRLNNYKSRYKGTGAGTTEKNRL